MDEDDFLADLDDLKVDDFALKKTRKLASEKGSSNAEDDIPLLPGATRSKRTSAGIQFAQKVLAVTKQQKQNNTNKCSR